MTDIIVAMAGYGWDYMETCNNDTLYFVANSMPYYGNTFLWLEEEPSVKKFSLEAVATTDDDCIENMDRMLVIVVKEGSEKVEKSSEMASLFDDEEDEDYVMDILWTRVMGGKR